MPPCEYGCGRPATHRFANGKYCCEVHNSKCPAQKKQILKAYKQSCLKKYGVENALKSPIVRKKHKQIMEEIYSPENSEQLRVMYAKQWETKRKIYTYISKSKRKPKKIKLKPVRWKFDLKEKVCSLCGAPGKHKLKSGEWRCSRSRCPVIRKKRSEVWTDEIKKKRKQTVLDTYGVPHIMQVQKVKDKKDQTMMETYGTTSYARTPQFKENLINTHFGENNHQWQGGISFEPYCPVWQDREYKESIRKRDAYTCQHCGITERLSLIVYRKILCLHHINYDKKDCNPRNLITVCIACNAKANTNRSEWQSYYENIITERIYSISC